jgi:outer membrane autotransporter protein
MLRADFYSMQATNATVGLANQSFDGRGYSLTSSAGYRIDLPANWFIEPSIGAVWSNTSIESLLVPGGGPFGVPAGTTSFDDVKSFLARAGVRVGTSIVSGNLVLQPFATASIWHEFADPTRASFECGGCAFALDVATQRIGTYGQFGLGSAVAVGNSGWLGYGRVDYRTGDHVEGWGVNFGLRYQWDQGAAVVATRY